MVPRSRALEGERRRHPVEEADGLGVPARRGGPRRSPNSGALGAGTEQNDLVGMEFLGQQGDVHPFMRDETPGLGESNRAGAWERWSRKKWQRGGRLLESPSVVIPIRRSRTVIG